MLAVEEFCLRLDVFEHRARCKLFFTSVCQEMIKMFQCGDQVARTSVFHYRYWSVSAAESIDSSLSFSLYSRFVCRRYMCLIDTVRRDFPLPPVSNFSPCLLTDLDICSKMADDVTWR